MASLVNRLNFRQNGLRSNGDTMYEPMELNKDVIYNPDLYTSIEADELLDILKAKQVTDIAAKPYIKIEKGKVILKQIRIERNLIVNGTIEIDIAFQLCSFVGIEMEDCTVASNLKFETCFLDTHFRVFSSTFKGEFLLKSSNVRILRFQNSTFSHLNIDGINVHPRGIPQYDLTSCKFDHLFIKHFHFPVNLTMSHLVNEGHIELSRINALWFVLNDISNEKRIFAEEICATIFSIQRLYNYGILKFNSIKARPLGATVSLINFQNVYFSKAELLFVEFNSFDIKNIFSCRLQEVSFISCIWKWHIFSHRDDGITTGFAEENMMLYQRPFEEKQTARERIANWWEKEKQKTKRYFFLEQENYRQLRHAASSGGDLLLEKYFYGREMGLHAKTLSVRRGLGTKIILVLSNWSSRYGQSLKRPILTLLFINLPIFLYLLAYGPGNEIRLVPPSQHDWGAFEIAMGKFVEFLNPLHPGGKKLEGRYYLLDLLARIVSSYSIYNFVRATRRFINR